MSRVWIFNIQVKKGHYCYCLLKYKTKKALIFKILTFSKILFMTEHSPFRYPLQGVCNHQEAGSSECGPQLGAAVVSHGSY